MPSSTLTSDIYKGLMTTLTGISGIPQLVYENIQYEPNNEIFIQVKNQLPDSGVSTMGANKFYRNTGILILDIKIPKNDGPEGAQETYDKIRNGFSPGSVITYNSVNIHIERISARDSVERENTVEYPIYIFYYCYDS